MATGITQNYITSVEEKIRGVLVDFIKANIAIAKSLNIIFHHAFFEAPRQVSAARWPFPDRRQLLD